MKILTYVGCYTDARREGIHIFESDTETGAFRRLGVVGGIENAIFLALSPARPRLYAAQGLPAYGDRQTNGCVAAYAVSGDTLTPLNHRPVGVTPPCYVALAPDERAVVFAEYAHAVSGVFELTDEGLLADTPPATVRHAGRGPDPVRQEGAHAHCAVVTPDGRHLCIADLGLDQVKVYDFPSRAASLTERPGLTFSSAPAAGPRHLLFHPNGSLAFLLHELDNTLSSLRYTGDAFQHLQTVPLLPKSFSGFSKASAVKLSADGRRLFGSNRGHDSIAAYDLDPDTGRLTLAAISRLAGQAPRDFTFMPGERFALVGHQDSDELMAYAYEPGSGRLTPASAPFPLHRPVAIVFGAPREPAASA